MRSGEAFSASSSDRSSAFHTTQLSGSPRQQTDLTNHRLTGVNLSEKLSTLLINTRKRSAHGRTNRLRHAMMLALI
jgi:hypothetical protein